MADPLAVWHDEHVNIARLLDLLEAQVTAFHRAEHPNYDLMADIVFYLQSFSDCIHHRRENVAFARLVERDGAMARVINALLQEHRVIATAGNELARRLEEVTEDVMAPRAALEAAAARRVGGAANNASNPTDATSRTDRFITISLTGVAVC